MQMHENKEIVNKIIPKTSLRPEEISTFVTFLCSLVASYFTGQFISIDSGLTINGFYSIKD